MARGRRAGERRAMWVATTELARSPERADRDERVRSALGAREVDDPVEPGLQVVARAEVSEEGRGMGRLLVLPGGRDDADADVQGARAPGDGAGGRVSLRRQRVPVADRDRASRHGVSGDLGPGVARADEAEGRDAEADECEAEDGRAEAERARDRSGGGDPGGLKRAI